MSEQTKAKLRQAVLEKYAAEMWGLVNTGKAMCESHRDMIRRDILAEFATIAKL